MEYMQKINDILEIVGVGTQPMVIDSLSNESLKQLCNMRKNDSSKQSTSSMPAVAMVTSGAVSSQYGDRVITGQPMECGVLEQAADATLGAKCDLHEIKNESSQNAEDGNGQRGGEFDTSCTSRPSCHISESETNQPKSEYETSREGFLSVESVATTPDSGVMSLLSTETEDTLSHVYSDDDTAQES